MNDIFQFIQQVFTSITWPVASLIIVLLLRKQIYLLFNVLSNRISAAQEIEFDGKKITIKGLVQQVAETKKELKETKQELTDIVTTGTPDPVAFKELRHAGEKITIKNRGIRIPGLNIESFKTEDASTELKTISTQELITSHLQDDNPEPVKNPGDPQAGRWGGVSSKSNRELLAKVEPLPNNLYKIKLVVRSVSDSDPLRGKVVFHLHPTFANVNPETEVTNGQASLTLLAWGSFTVGAETDNKRIRLELDLAKVPGVPQHFIDN